MNHALAEAWIPPPALAQPGEEAGWNAVASWLGTPFPLADGVTAVASVAEAPPAARIGLSVAFGDRPPVLAVPASFPFRSLFGSDLAVDDLPILPDGLREALVEGIGLSLLALLPAGRDGPARIVDRGPWRDLPGAAGPMRWFGIALHGREQDPILVDLGIPPRILASLLGDGPFAPLPRRAAWPSLAARLTCTLHETLGRVVLPLAALRTLRPGAVIVLSETVEPAVALFRLGDGTSLEFRPAEGGWVYAARHLPPRAAREDPVRPASPPPEDTSPMDSTASSPPLRLDGLPVAIDLDLGQITVALADIESWQVGALVPLDPIRPDEGVEIVLRANGRVLGTGDLVRLDERLGVRITRLSLD